LINHYFIAAIIYTLTGNNQYRPHFLTVPIVIQGGNKMIKNIAKIFSCILLLIIIASCSARAQESKNDCSEVNIIIAYNVKTEGNRFCFFDLESDVPAYIVDGTTMVPLRALAEGFGYDVSYQKKDRKIIIKDAKGENELVFMVGSTAVLKNDQADTMLQTPVIRGSRTFIPLRYVSEFFGKYVTWKKSIDGVSLAALYGRECA